MSYERNAEMDKWMARMVYTMQQTYKVTTLNDWQAKPNSPVPAHSPMNAVGPDADPYACLSDLTETRYDIQFTDGYMVRWSPSRGTFFLYKNAQFVHCYPTRY